MRDSVSAINITLSEWKQPRCATGPPNEVTPRRRNANVTSRGDRARGGRYRRFCDALVRRDELALRESRGDFAGVACCGVGGDGAGCAGRSCNESARRRAAAGSAGKSERCCSRSGTGRTRADGAGRTGDGTVAGGWTPREQRFGGEADLRAYLDWKRCACGDAYCARDNAAVGRYASRANAAAKNPSPWKFAPGSVRSMLPCTKCFR